MRPKDKICFLLLGSTVKKRERLSSKAVCAMALTSGGLKTTASVARTPSAALRRPYTVQPSIPASMVTSCACVSTWMAWIVELEDTLLCLFTWCRAIMIASLSGHLPEGSPLPSWTNPRELNFVSTSARPLLPSPVYWPFSGQQLRATSRGMATWSLLRSSTSAILSTLKTIPCWFAFRLIIEKPFAPIQRFRQFYFSIKPGSRNWKIPLKSPFWFVSYTHIILSLKFYISCIKLFLYKVYGIRFCSEIIWSS